MNEMAKKSKQLSTIIKNRRSIRKYSSKAVGREQIEAIIEAAVLAPSAKNRQPWKYIVYTGDGKHRDKDHAKSWKK